MVRRIARIVSGIFFLLIGISLLFFGIQLLFTGRLEAILIVLPGVLFCILGCELFTKKKLKDIIDQFLLAMPW